MNPKRIAFVVWLVLASAGARASAQCVVFQNSKCESTFGPSCQMQSGSTCYRDAVQCRTSCGTGGWQDCEFEPSACRDYQW